MRDAGEVAVTDAFAHNRSWHTLRYYLSWRNARLNNAPLSEEALAHLQLYGMPSSGRLQLDYVSYQVHSP